MQPEINRNAPVNPEDIQNLRIAIGWEPLRAGYEDILRKHFCYYIARDENGTLIGYVSILSDGLADAFLLDLMVHPGHRKSGLGKRIVQRAISDMKQAGIQCVQVTFDNHLEPFYSKCGFHIFKGGIIDFHHMEWTEEEH